MSIDIDDMVQSAKSRIAYAIDANAKYELKKMREAFAPKPEPKIVCDRNNMQSLQMNAIAASQNVYNCRIGNLYSLQNQMSSDAFSCFLGNFLSPY